MDVEEQDKIGQDKVEQDEIVSNHDSRIAANIYDTLSSRSKNPSIRSKRKIIVCSESIIIKSI